jgi:hypothetical protein
MRDQIVDNQKKTSMMIIENMLLSFYVKILNMILNIQV